MAVASTSGASPPNSPGVRNDASTMMSDGDREEDEQVEQRRSR